MSAHRQDGPVVEITAGTLRGVNRGTTVAFLGVPYCADAGGARRFAPPAPIKHWAGIREASVFGPRAPQDDRPEGGPDWRAFVRDYRERSEDCLVLNVFAPKQCAAPCPVMVWLHGGGFNTGCGSPPGNDGAALAERGVAVVTLNHRLNAFGFVYRPELGSESANAGMRDIVAALEWVRDNIAVFGGDPGNVTIFGQSGGGSKVAVLMAMPAAAGLFHRAIIQSASSLIRMATPEQAERCTALLFDELGDGEADVHAVLAARKRAIARNGGRDDFRPVVDGAVLPAHPFEPTAPELSSEIPLLIGTCADETSFMMGANGPNAFDIGEAELRQRIARFMKLAQEQSDPLVDSFIAIHPDETPGKIMVRISSEEMYRRNCILAAERKAEQKAASVFMYQFRWKSEAQGGRLGTPHTMCIPFVFGTIDAALPMLGRRKEALALSRRVMDAWVTFARSGVPGHGGLPDWPAFEPEGRATMIFDDQCYVDDDPLSADRHALAPYPFYTSDMVGMLGG